MHCTRKLAQDIYWVGADDRRLEKFENLFPIPRGVSYNSYLILDEKTVLLDSADETVGRTFEANVEHLLEGRPLDYLIIQHMEPDHAACIARMAQLYPEMKLLGSAQAGTMLKQFFPLDLSSRFETVKEGDILATGNHTLSFIAAPMVHWPEVLMTYDMATQTLFSADAFGTFGALNGHIFADEVNFDRDWLDDARRYYANIVGKYGGPVQAVLKKAASLQISMIAPLHGPVWRQDLEYILHKYDLWSRCQPETQGVVICYGSMYGNTANAANALACRLGEAGVKDLAVYDLSTTHLSTIMGEIWRASTLVIASPTYNGGLYPPVEALLNDMKALAVQNRRVALIENGSWAPASGRMMRSALEGLKNVTLLESGLTIRSALQESAGEQMEALVKEILAGL
ncbi:FprA family A-type flavoprotein [Fournierella massiliensis]|nr:FprA family A-type flavoprotein [Fournierella massiliensis]MCF2556900.1 FprA family A-type flavoprotein [Fournierella massiliensis]